MPKHFCNGIWASRVEWRSLTFQRLRRRAKHLATRGLVEPCCGAEVPHRFENANDTKSGDVAGQHRLVPGRSDKRLSRQIVHLIRHRSLHGEVER